jgi:hypothetical protein
MGHHLAAFAEFFVMVWLFGPTQENARRDVECLPGFE